MSRLLLVLVRKANSALRLPTVLPDPDEGWIR